MLEIDFNTKKSIREAFGKKPDTSLLYSVIFYKKFKNTNFKLISLTIFSLLPAYRSFLFRLQMFPHHDLMFYDNESVCHLP